MLECDVTDGEVMFEIIAAVELAAVIFEQLTAFKTVDCFPVNIVLEVVQITVVEEFVSLEKTEPAEVKVVESKAGNTDEKIV